MANGCLAALTAGLAFGLVGLALTGLIATTYAAAHAAPLPRASRAVAPTTGPAVDLRSARRIWGSIRARYPSTNRRVPA